jgi:hypothetical protein
MCRCIASAAARGGVTWVAQPAASCAHAVDGRGRALANALPSPNPATAPLSRAAACAVCTCRCPHTQSVAHRLVDGVHPPVRACVAAPVRTSQSCTESTFPSTPSAWPLWQRSCRARRSRPLYGASCCQSSLKVWSRRCGARAAGVPGIQCSNAFMHAPWAVCQLCPAGGRRWGGGRERAARGPGVAAAAAAWHCLRGLEVDCMLEPRAARWAGATPLPTGASVQW